MQKSRTSSLFLGYVSLAPLAFAFLCTWGAIACLNLSFAQALGLGIGVALAAKLLIFFRVMRKLRS